MSTILGVFLHKAPNQGGCTALCHHVESWTMYSIKRRTVTCKYGWKSQVTATDEKELLRKHK